MFLFLIAFMVATMGTLVGAGGGIILMPILFFLYPHAPHGELTALSMLTVACNASSGSLAYGRKKLVHFRAAGLFILASLPGALLGTHFASWIERDLFEKIFGLILFLYALYLLFKKNKTKNEQSLTAHSELSRQAYLLGAVISFLVGFIASFLGIGGGVIHVPLLAQVLSFPVPLAAGTSHFILAVTAWASTLEHLYAGNLPALSSQLFFLAAGAVCGAQLGARLSQYVTGPVILKILGMILLLVGLRLLFF